MNQNLRNNTLYCDIDQNQVSPLMGPEASSDPFELMNDVGGQSRSSANLDDLLEELKSEADENSQQSIGKSKKEVYKFKTEWLISNVCWSNDGQYKLALSSFIEEYKNFVQVVQLARDDPDQEVESVLTFEHPYPATKVQWIPQQSDNSLQLIATSADYLRLWRIDQGDDIKPNGAKLECLLNSNQGSKLCAPLTSFDWSEDGSSIVTSSVDTTCAIWDINTAALANQISTSSTRPTCNNLKTQLVAHDNHVYDVAWMSSGTGKDVFVSCSADGSVRLFDLRELSTSTVLYDDNMGQHHQRVIGRKERASLVRVSCSKMESNLVATFASDSSDLIILDTRNPGKPLSVLNKHLDSVNSISWSAQSPGSICSGANDSQALIWQISIQPPETGDHKQISEPLLAYRANGKINSTSWAPSNIWVAIGYRNYLELLRV
ncbi:DDB1- and CUL4-associated factor 7 [Olea europaea subsp. europaea]|uniref:DDB1- and CUL4-associated factor 7 n=1 Tax=Olea europaea subsp. europaea TaxID=158383 RepID=A0A8S0V8E0_OLEEU|nr:DDB1- and CUL4-associated factor 7 [Olea europaea subsp. europaea]